MPRIPFCAIQGWRFAKLVQFSSKALTIRSKSVFCEHCLNCVRHVQITIKAGHYPNAVKCSGRLSACIPIPLAICYFYSKCPPILFFYSLSFIRCRTATPKIRLSLSLTTSMHKWLVLFLPVQQCGRSAGSRCFYRSILRAYLLPLILSQQTAEVCGWFCAL